MNQVRYYRKYPRTVEKLNEDSEDWTLDLSAITAAGILLFAFAKGMFWGFMLKKRLG